MEDLPCVNEKLETLKTVQIKVKDAKEKQECRDGSQMRNQGLSYAGATDIDTLAGQIAPKISFKPIQLGKTSDIAADGGRACKALPYVLSVNTLSPQDPNGFGGVADSADGTTTQCFEFSSADELTRTLPRLEDDTDKLSSTGKLLVVGDQGSDNDTELQDCKNSVDGLENCVPVSITEGVDFKKEATISCNNVKNPNFNKLFGGVTIEEDPRCTVPGQSFMIVGGSPSDSACGARTMTIERRVQGCCGNTAVIEHVLNIEQTAPTITQQPGSMDVKTTCDANIHLSQFGQPSFDGGCAVASHVIAVDQTDPVFDESTCTTTLQRTFKLTENGCEDQGQLFEQTITLQNNYAPQFDSFPPDKAIGVFDSYGTQALGFPTAFQQCGLPVDITYSDDISKGKCFAERVLRRTFRVVDSCGHRTERVQTITISNAPDSLPLGDKSLASIYGYSKLQVYDNTKSTKSSKSSTSCTVSSDKCGIYGAPDYKCAKSSKSSKNNKDRFVVVREEFAPYQSRLASLPNTHLSQGVIASACACPEGDIGCDKRVQEKDSLDTIYFGTAVTTASGTCNAVLKAANRDKVEEVAVEEVDCPISKKSGKSSKSMKVDLCFEMTLSGSNPVYNFFEITVNDFHDKTISIDVPPTSIVLVNVVVPEEDIGEKIYLGQNSSKGIVLGEGMVAHNVLWNVLGEIDINLHSPEQDDWAFYGTLLNPYGNMKLKTSKNSPVVWKGQLFSYSVNAYKHFEEFQCGGHFAGFASCENLIPNEEEDF